MAYKFQIGDAIMSGALEQANGITVDEGGLTVTAGGVAVTAGGISVTAGALALNSQGITAAGSIAGASTIAASGLANLDGGIEIDNGGNKFTVSTAGAVVAESSVSGAAGTFDALAGTSLALQGGGITAAGAIAGASTIAASGLANLNGGIEVDNGGNKFTVSSAGAVVAESSVSGAAGTFDALAGTSLALQGGGITAAGAIAGASTVSATGNIGTSGGSVSGSAGLAGLGLTIAPGKTVGVVGDTDLMALDANTVTVNGTLSCDTSFTLDAVTVNATELGFIDGVTAGTVAASKALVVDASRNLGSGVDGINNLFLDGNLDADGTLSVDGLATFNGAMKMGDAAGDIIGITGSIGSTVLPDIASAWNLGSVGKPWKAIYVDSIIGGSVAWDVVICDGGNTISASAELAVVREGNVTVGLPDAEAGRNVRVKLSSSVGYVTIAPQTGELIEGSAASVLLESTGSAVTFACMQGGGWVIL